MDKEIPNHMTEMKVARDRMQVLKGVLKNSQFTKQGQTDHKLSLSPLFPNIQAARYLNNYATKKNF